MSAVLRISVAVILVALVANVALGECESPTFRWAPVYETGSEGAQAFAFANANGDGLPDVVVGHAPLNNGVGAVALLTGAGAGGFRLEDSVETGAIRSIDVADFDGDGDDDVVAAGTNEIITLRNDRLRLTISNRFNGGSGPVAAGDFDGDGRADFLAAAGSPALSLFRGLGDGRFVESNWRGPDVEGDLAAADFDRDGRTDVAVASGSKSINVLFGDRDGAFATSVHHEFAYQPLTIHVTDLDGDGRTDLVVQFRDYAPLSVVWDVARGTASVKTSYSPDTRFELVRLALADFDGDGDIDAAVPTVTGVQILERTSDAFLTNASYLAASLGHRYRSLRAGDIDRDGDPDLVLATEGGLSVLLNHGGVFDAPQRVAAASDAVGDFDGDGLDDILDFGRTRLASQNGRFSTAGNIIPDLMQLDGPPDASVADLNGDGKLDFVYVLRMSRIIGLGKGDGTFDVRREPSPERQPIKSYLTDVDRDGDFDFVMISILRANADFVLSVARGSGDGTFQPIADRRITHYAERLILGDFNGDGYVDLSFAHLFSSSHIGVAVVMNDRSGSFGPFLDTELSFTKPLFAADVSADRYDDLVVTGPRLGDFDSIQVAHSRGASGAFTTPRVFDAGVKTAAEVFVRDFNDDGHDDILVVEETGTTDTEGLASFLSGDGFGGFSAPHVFRTTGLRPVLIGDFNGDGRPDLLDGGHVRINQCAERSVRRRAVRR